MVPTRDRPALLAESLASIRAVEGPDIELEIIVADNAVSRSAEPIARRFSARYVAVREPGASAARNAALQAATGEFIAFSDDDDLWLPSHVRTHLSVLTAHPEFGAVIGQVINTDMSGGHRGPAWPARLSADGDVRSEFFLFQPQIGATIVRAQIAREVGDFDPQLVGDQDWDWHFRLAARTRVGFVAAPMVLFRQRPAGADTQLSWKRLGFTTTVMWRNALRMPTVIRPRTVRAFVAHRGTFSLRFRQAAQAHYDAGDIHLARTAMRYSFVASPIHFLASLARDRSVTPMFLGIVAGRRS